MAKRKDVLFLPIIHCSNILHVTLILCMTTPSKPPRNTRRIVVLTTEASAERYFHAAKSCGLSVCEWARQLFDQASEGK